MNSMTIFIRPIPAPRPRVTKYGTYNDPKYTAYKKAIGLYIKRKFNVSDKPLRMNIEFMFKIPKSWSKKKKETMQYHTSTPDIDNLVKGVMDSLNGIAYKDDSQVVEIIARKFYGSDDCITVSVEHIV